jgi:hypothetical protein
MRQLFIFCGLFLVLLVLLDRLTGAVLSRMYEQVKTGQTGGKINQYLSLPQTPTLVIMGNSRSLYQVIPDSFSTTAFNLSHAGMGPAFQTGLLSVLADRQRLPDTILLHIEPSDFSSEQSNQDVLQLKYYYTSNAVVKKYTDAVAPLEKYKLISECYRFNGRVLPLIKNFLIGTPTTPGSNGYEPISPSPADSMTTRYSYARYSRLPQGIYNADQLKFLDDFLRLCSAQGVEVIAFTSPSFKKVNTYAAISEQLHRYFASHHIRYIDLQQLLPDGFYGNTKYWKDAYHLNHLGAQQQTQHLVSHVRQHGVR